MRMSVSLSQIMHARRALVRMTMTNACCVLFIVYDIILCCHFSLSVTGVRGTKKKAHHQQDTFLVIFARTHRFQAACTDNIRHQHLTGLRLPAAGLPIKIAKNRMQ
jgi:hypothetical protein